MAARAATPSAFERRWIPAIFGHFASRVSRGGSPVSKRHAIKELILFASGSIDVNQSVMATLQHRARIEDWTAETPESVNARLEGAKGVQAQTRFTLGTMTLLAMMMLIVTYNAYLSFDSEWAFAEAAARRETKTKEDTSVPDMLADAALKDWVSSQSVTIALLGIRVSVDDAPVLGTSALMVLSFWLLLLVRRENHTIGFLLRDTDTQPSARHLSDDESAGAQERYKYGSGQRWLIFHTIISNSLFVTFDGSMSRVQSLDGATPLTVRSANGLKARLSRAAFQLVRTFFFLFPVFASAIVFGFDRWSYFRPDPFAAGGKIMGASGPFFWQSMLVFFVCWIPLAVCCGRSGQYSRATENVLHEYGNKLRGDLWRHQQASRPEAARA
jgi:hypothetical protein